MDARINFAKVARGVYEAMLGLEKYLSQCGLEESLLHLIKLRASQINGCAYCLDMHWKDLRAAGETEQRMYGLDAWAESPYYSDRERAALAWTEAVTHIREGHVSEWQAGHRHHSFLDQGDGNSEQICPGSARYRHTDGVASGPVPARFRAEAFGTGHRLFRQSDY